MLAFPLVSGLIKFGWGQDAMTMGGGGCILVVCHGRLMKSRITVNEGSLIESSKGEKDSTDRLMRESRTGGTRRKRGRVMVSLLKELVSHWASGCARADKSNRSTHGSCCRTSDLPVPSQCLTYLVFFEVQQRHQSRCVWWEARACILVYASALGHRPHQYSQDFLKFTILQRFLRH
jgi:hypothetical protein